MSSTLLAAPDRLDAEGGAIETPLRHLDASAIAAAVQRETRNREVHLPPVSVYRWWARRTEAVNGAVIDAFSKDRPGRLLVSDPFSGGGIIPLAAAMRGHQVYAQDLNPWAAEGLTAMLGLPDAEVLAKASADLGRLIEPTLKKAYGTVMPDGAPARISHTFRVLRAGCSACGTEARIFPHALVSLKVRKERGRPEAFLACPKGHLFEGRSDKARDCPVCQSRTDPTADYTQRREVTCRSCGAKEKLEQRMTGAKGWEVVLVERTAERRRELGFPTDAEIRQAARGWDPKRDLGKIPEGQEARVLRRHGFRHWQDLYPARQRVVIERLLAAVPEASESESVRLALELAIVGSAEMAGHLSRWDRWYLKSYESMAGHRFNFTTFSAEPNVWGTSASGRGTVSRRLVSFGKAANWLHERVERDLTVEGPIRVGSSDAAQMNGDIRVVEGSSEAVLLPDKSVDLVLTDPPYHDDVQYSELSLPLRAWADLSTDDLEGEALVKASDEAESRASDYEELLQGIFAESRRTLRPDGHLIFSYANREPEAWVALLAALQSAGLQSAGCQVVRSENETDYAKRDVRACTLDLMMDLVPGEADRVKRWRPRRLPDTDEAAFLRVVMTAFMKVGRLEEGWQRPFVRNLKASRFLQAPGTQQTLRRR